MLMSIENEFDLSFGRRLYQFEDGLVIFFIVGNDAGNLFFAEGDVASELDEGCFGECFEVRRFVEGVHVLTFL